MNKITSIVLLLLLFSFTFVSCDNKNATDVSNAESTKTSTSSHTLKDNSANADDTSSDVSLQNSTNLPKSSSEILIEEIDVVCKSEIDQCLTTQDIVETYYQYAEKWNEVAEDYYNKLLIYENVHWDEDEYFPSSEDFHTYIADSQTNWDNYYEQEIDNYRNILLSIHRAGTIQRISLANHVYELEKYWALHLVHIYESL